MTRKDTRGLASRARAHALRMTHRARASHIGSCLSCADILAVLYGSTMRFDPARPDWPGRDRLVVSKGHAAAIVYAVLAESGFLPVEELELFSTDGSRLCGHVTVTVPGVEISTGSLRPRSASRRRHGAGVVKVEGGMAQLLSAQRR